MLQIQKCKGAQPVGQTRQREVGNSFRFS